MHIISDQAVDVAVVVTFYRRLTRLEPLES